jgi:adenosylhomocysteine nucleosidase
MSEQGGRPAPRVAPPPVPADVGIVAALPIEVGPLLASFREARKYSGGRLAVHEGYCGARLVALCVAGMGAAKARAGAELLLAGHRPRWLLSVGFAGALDPDLARNAALCPHEVVDSTGNRLDIGVKVDVSDESRDLRPGRLLSVEAIVRTAAEKAALRTETGADALDMETFPVAHLCAERGVRFLAVRVISDDAQTDLPPEVLAIVGPTGSYRIGAAVGALWHRPSSIKDMLRLREHAHQAARRLAEVVPAVVARLGGE